MFIGLLWESWGQPTGKYSSGFEEEYERALARRKGGDEPEIWMVFKAVNPEKAKDPGTELSKVLEFRKTQGSLREVLYKEVVDLNDWKAKLQNWLWAHVTKQAIPAPQSIQPQQPASATEQLPGDATTGETEISQQLLRTAASLTRVIKSGDLEFGRNEADLLQEFDVTRLFLLSATWMSRRYTNDTLGTHEMNLLYKYRGDLDLTTAEHHQMFRSVLVDTGDVIPGWLWFSGMTLDSLMDLLFALSTRDSSSQVRKAALQLLRNARINLPENLWSELPLSDDVREVRAEAYEYLASTADDRVFPLLENNIAVEQADAGAQVRETRLSILLRLRPHDAFKELIETGQYVSDETIRKLETLASEFDDETLLKAAESQWEDLRRFSVKELARRRHLSESLAQQLIQDPSVKIRELGFTELARRGHPLELKKIREALLDEKSSQSTWGASLAGLLGGGETKDEVDADAVILTLYRHQSAEKVLDSVRWFGLEGVLAYKSLATDHYDAVRDRLRSDLEDGFTRLKKQSVEEIEASLGTEVAKNVVEQFKSVDDFIRSQFVEAALVGLATNCEPEDIRFGRQYLLSENTAISFAALRIVCKFGNSNDVPELLRISRKGWGQARDRAGMAALRFSSEPIEVALELTKSSSARLVSAGYEWLYKQSSAEVEEFFEASIDSKNETGRLRSVYYFYRKRKREELEKILETLLNRETYYYNVVTWLDRLLYSPTPLSEYFIRDLETQAT